MATNLRSINCALALAVTMAAAPTIQAAGFGDMFNPGRWFGGNDDDYYYDGPYGQYGYGPYGVPGYGPSGAPGYGYGYGAMPYGYGPGIAPGYGAPAAMAPMIAAPAAATSDAKDQEIEALKRRIDELEARQSGTPPASSAGEGGPSVPAFRPMDKH
ncbi:MAG: hypothetical protein WBG92_25655 [Thiohalocapsa sp.]